MSAAAKDKSVRGKVALITGATSGIGRATAEIFARDGAILVVAGRRQAAGDELVRDLAQAGAQAMFVATDIARQDDIDNLVEKAIERFGRIDILVNNAGYGGREHYLTHEYQDETCDKYISTNLLGTLRMCRAVIPHMLAIGGGSIVNTSSLAAHLAVPYDSIYGATKAAIQDLTRTIAVEYGKRGIRCNCVLPGLTRTEMIPEGSGIEEMVKNTVPLGRAATPDEIGECILFLASERASFCTGASLIADGGQAVF